MKAKFGLAVLLLSALFWAPGGPAAQLAGSRLEPLQTPLLQPASMTVAPEAPVVVPSAAALNSRGWAGSAAIAPTEDLTADVLAAYTLAVAVSPAQCHLTTPVLAAIGQVESGNLAGHTLDSAHRVSPEILGPVLDGTTYRAVQDTDAGHWDHNTKWDRALGPMQIIPASWRVVGLDMDGDGVRDPQNIYDSAGAAMAYLCADGRDLSTAAGLKQAVLSYNQSDAYLRAVLAWKSVFDNADLEGSGAVPFVAALDVPMTGPQSLAATSTRTPAPASTTTAAEPASPAVPVTRPGSPSATPTTPSTPSSSTTPSSPGTTAPPASTPSAPATTAPDPTPADPTPVDPTPASPPADPTPANPPADPTPADPTPLPVCPVPTDEPTTEAPVTQDEPVVSPETCTAPDGYQFDLETGLLVPVPATSPTP
ncbi:lytic transglycosylase domain-containing protein [Marmoricola sp. URHB0036]|uniref:lytic transglycosylase domain-containing protein n=1 Tax=Marmoricola sp. URHB0036 TaxID=1298863 RepID=UPI000422BC47|nr:lytic transglycosylase domain-containing protein [Marmoricola sp. URHB0036]